MNRQSLRRAYNRWAMSLTLALVLGFPVVPFIPLPVISEAEAAPARRPAARTARRTTRRHHQHHRHHRHRAVRGTVVVHLPPGCSTVRTRGVTYHHCYGVYYTQQYQGTSLVYVVVDAP